MSHDGRHNMPDAAMAAPDLEAGGRPEQPHQHQHHDHDRDREQQQQQQQRQDTLDKDDDAANAVSFSGPSDPLHPRNWPRARKWKTTVAVSLFVFVSPVSSAMIAPALADVARDLRLRGNVETYLAMAIFVLAYAVGPVVFGPLSEMYGRVRVLQLTNVWYLAWNLGCGLARGKGQLFAFRFLAGIGGSAPLAVGGGAVSDMWRPEERGKAMGLYTMGPMLGPVVGPIAGGFIAQYSTWRWVFYATSIAAALVQVVGLVWLSESHPPTVLRRHLRSLVRDTGNTNLYVDDAAAGTTTTLGAALWHAAQRPVRMFATQPIVACIAVYMAYLFGTLYLMFATFPTIWTTVYRESPGIGGLNYLSIALGSFVGIFLQVKLVDRIYRNLKARETTGGGGGGRPEFRLPTMAAGSVLLTVGLFWYGWSIGRAHWIMPNIGALLVSTGVVCCLQSMQMYVVDCYQTYAASALATCAVLRSLAGFAFPLFAPYMYDALGYGWGTSILAFVSIALGWVAPALFWLYGPRLRAASKYASG